MAILIQIIDMKRLYFFLIAIIFATTILADIPTRYFVGKTEVSESFWDKIPDSINYAGSEFNYDTIIIKSRQLPITHYIDSISTPGIYVLRKRSPEVIAEMERLFAAVKQKSIEKSLTVSKGDSAPQINLVKFSNRETTENMIFPGQCYLLSFWATWCGSCLQELKPEFIPSITEKFRDNPSFHFVPICIDATPDDLQKFFSSETGKNWSYLSKITYLDTDRRANEKYGKSGSMPLNVIIGKDGTIRYIHLGAITDKLGLSELYEAIKAGL